MAFVETFRSVVAPADCDHLGHLNVSQYFAAVSSGVFAIQTSLGLGPKEVLDGRRLSFAVVHAESDFKSELQAGDVICLESAIEAIGEKLLTFRHRLRRVEDRKTAFETTFQCILLSLDTRKAVAIPDDIRNNCQAYMAE